MPELTPAARANLASGATSGAGTHLCGQCNGPKEESRVNSRTCRACSKGASREPERAAEPVSLARMLDRIAALEERADKQAAAIRDLRKYKHEH